MDYTEFLGSARWMSPGYDGISLVRKEFKLRQPVRRAVLDIVGLGMFRVWINGRRVNDDLYGTLATDFQFNDNEGCYKKHGERVSHRIYVNSLDVTDNFDDYVVSCIGIELAPGWYNAGYTKYGHPTNYGLPMLCFRLTVTYQNFEKEEIVSDDMLRWHKSNVVKHFFFEGEEHDYASIHVDGWSKAGYCAIDWLELKQEEAPITEFYRAPECPCDRVVRTITPKLIGKYDGGNLYDVKENITGTPVLRSLGIRYGEKLTFTVSERLLDGRLEDYTTHGQTSSFIADGKPDRDYKLSFMWNGFRYIWVSGNAVLKNVEVIHSDVKVTSGFWSDNKVLNWIYATYIRTQLDNMHCGIPSDCPHLEKRGYTGDGELVGECGMLLLDSESFYRKWIADIADCQDTVSGHVQYTAPYISSGGGPGGWGCAISEVPYRFWKYFGDEELVKPFIPRIKAYLGYLEAHSDERGLVVSDQLGEWCLGDWCTAEDIAIPEPFVNTYFYVKTIGQLIEICRLADKDAPVTELEELAKTKKAAIDREYFDAETGDYCGGVQGADAFALDLGMGDERTLANLVRKYGDENEVGYDTGIFGTDIVTRVLFERGYTDVAYRLMSSEKKYSFGRWMNDGCTTFPEYWTYKRSQNHPMFGAVTKYLFTKMLGIGQEGAGFENIVIAPQIPSELENIGGFVTVKSGEISVTALRVDGKVRFRIEVPQKARFVYGGTDIELNKGLNEFTV